jgi:hypothetical protein
MGLCATDTPDLQLQAMNEVHTRTLGRQTFWRIQDFSDLTHQIVAAEWFLKKGMVSQHIVTDSRIVCSIADVSFVLCINLFAKSKGAPCN